MLDRIYRGAAIAVAAFSFALAAGQSSAETAVGSTVESRVILAFKSAEAAVQARMPEGWKAIAFPRGPLTGANVLVSFIDRHLDMDAEGKPKDPSTTRGMAVVLLGVKPGVEGARLFVTRTYYVEPAGDPYGTLVTAEVEHALTLSGAGAERSRSETWRVAPEGGGEITLSLSHDVGRAVWSPSEAKSFSAVNPDFHRIYRYDSLTDVAMSAPMEKPLAGEMDFSVTVPDLAPMFDGSEEVIAVLSIPVRVRDIFLP